MHVGFGNGKVLALSFIFGESFHTYHWYG